MLAYGVIGHLHEDAMSKPESDESARRLKRLNQLLTTGTGDRGNYKGALKRLHEARRILHEELAHQIEPLLNEHVTKLPQSTLQDKQTLARQINADIRSLGLSIRCPKTGNSSFLSAGPGYDSSAGRFQLCLHKDRHRTCSSASLFNFNLMAGPPDRYMQDKSKETWRERSSAHLPPDNRAR